MTLDAYTQIRVDQFHKRCKNAGVKFEHRDTPQGEVVKLTRGSRVQRYLIPKKPAWMPNDDALIPQKLHGFLDQFLQECAR